MTDPDRLAPLMLEADDQEGRVLAQSILATTNAEAIFGRLGDFCHSAGLPTLEGVFFSEISVGATFGLVLADGTRVVLKAHPPERDRRFLEAACRVQEQLFRGGFPCPEPILGPAAFGGGHAIVEEFLDRGRRADAHDPGVRRAMAGCLARLIRLAATIRDTDDLRRDWNWPEDRIWPTPHNALFDFEKTAPGAEWIDDLALRAKKIVDASEGPSMVGHADWSVKHFRFEAGKVCAVYDWDSLRVTKEAILVGGAAATFPATWYLPVESRAPSPDEMRLFIGEYEAERGRAFTPTERGAVVAGALYAMAYGARCEHALDRGDADLGGGFREALRGRGDEYLRP